MANNTISENDKKPKLGNTTVPTAATTMTTATTTWKNIACVPSGSEEVWPEETQKNHQEEPFWVECVHPFSPLPPY